MEIGEARAGYDSLCHFNLSDGFDDPDADCGRAAAWHLRLDGEESERPCIQSCDLHHGIALRAGQVESFHQFGSACGLEGSWYVNGPIGCFCCSEERGVELGLLSYAEGS